MEDDELDDLYLKSAQAMTAIMIRDPEAHARLIRQVEQLGLCLQGQPCEDYYSETILHMH